jgi:outer membrane protein insertion porin family
MLVPEAELRKLIKMKVGEVFSRERGQSRSSSSPIDWDDGYAFANVNASPQLEKAKRRVYLFIDQGAGFIRRINITGRRTRDEVIRREMRQFEGGWYSASKISARSSVWTG